MPKTNSVVSIVSKSAKTHRKPKKSKRARTIPAVRGHGDYSKPQSKWGKWAMKTGSLGGDLLSHIFGQGDYTPKFNSLMDAGGPPQFINDRTSRSTVLRHREYVQDVFGSINFNIQQFAITPSNSVLFPWLASTASNFEEFRIHGMIFEFKSTAGDAVSSTNNALGTVVMATQYDPTDAAFANKIQMENHEYCTSSKPSCSFLHGLECKPSLTVAPQLYTGSTVAATGAVRDIRFTTFGNFYIATVGMQANNINIGELWVSYEIELLKPTLSYPVVVNSLNLSILGAVSGSFFSGGTAGQDGATYSNLPQLSCALGSYTISGETITFNDPRLAGHTFAVTSETQGSTVASNPLVSSLSNGTILSTRWSAVGTTVATTTQQLFFNPNPTNTWVLTMTPSSATTGTQQSRFYINVIA